MFQLYNKFTCYICISIFLIKFTKRLCMYYKVFVYPMIYKKKKINKI